MMGLLECHKRDYVENFLAAGGNDYAYIFVLLGFVL